MKKLFAIIGIMIALQASSNPVTFCVDMRYWTIDPGGIHLYIVGDTVFHPMTQSIIDTNIYCLTLDLPSDSCIEYDFLNGSDFYGLEFVPPESRVDDINSNRWICTHGTTTDTLETGALLFAANAPEGQSMLRLKVDMVQQSSIDTAGVFVSGSLGTNIRMDNLFHGNVYDAKVYVLPGSYDYRFYNGSTSESVPTACSVNGSRQVSFTVDTVVSSVCFSECIACGTAIESVETATPIFSVFPNPANDRFRVSTEFHGASRLSLTDLSGKTVREFELSETDIRWFDISSLSAGSYLVTVRSSSGQSLAVDRLIIR
ncbi:MAG: hypothetical protein RL021_292 [Bacteroidota bacterium]|jgi:hypothetical protein